MNYWFISIVHVISTCTATSILYVLPDNVSDVNCPSQPCATLDQYLLDNRSLPVVVNAEYHFLPGEHYITTIMQISLASNFSLIGVGISPVKWVCWPQTNLAVSNSYNVTIKNLAFSHCNGFYEFNKNVPAGLILKDCYFCTVEDIIIWGHGFVGYNMLQKSFLNNITINIDATTSTALKVCHRKFFLVFGNAVLYSEHESILVNKVFVTGHNEMCCHLAAVEIQMYQFKYSVSVELRNSQFYNIDRSALVFEMFHFSSSLSIKNCTFEHCNHRWGYLAQLINGMVSSFGMNVSFEDCDFYNNAVSALIVLEYSDPDLSHVHSTNTTFVNCNFIGNVGDVLKMANYAPGGYKVNINFIENVNIVNNTGDKILTFVHMAVLLNGTVTISNNYADYYVLQLYFSDITFTKIVKFVSNICSDIMHLKSLGLPYIKVTDYTSIAFTDNICTHQVISIEATVNDVFPHCFFQYMTSTNITGDILRLYAISFNENKPHENTDCYADTLLQFLTHCKWLSEAVFSGHDPGYVNQQIIQFNGHQWTHHKRICYCPHDGVYNCTVDVLGPIFPGQMLQVNFCNPEADRDYIVYAETHAVSLPKLACKIAHQSELINTLRNYSKMLNFTIISENKVCELFLTEHKFVQVEYFSRIGFYVQLSPCPVGFTLQNGKCDCDPFLPPDIDTCYIDLSAITRPANTWITAHTLANNTTNYLISDCPMDYCLPYSTNVNLLYPDLQCQFNRTGMLCSQCQHPLSMVFASSRCMKCTNVHILITIIVIVAGIVLVVLLYVLNLTVTKGTINGIIFYANIISINDSVFLVNDNVLKPLRVFISFTNLDLGIETCFYDGMDSYAKMWLQLFFPSYLIIIAVSIIIASRYSSRILRLTYSRSLPVLATLFLLSYTGVLRVVLTVLFSYSTITEYPSGDKEIVWSIDASVPLFGSRFTILFITCLVLFLILIPFNITLLFTRFLFWFRMINRFKPLLDAFQGPYKDKYYYWVAVNIIFRYVFFSLYGFEKWLRVFLATTILVIFTTCYGYIRPNKSKAVNIQTLSLLVNLTLLHAVSLLDNEKAFTVVTNFLIGLTLMQFCIIVLYCFLTYALHCNFVIKEKLMKIGAVRNTSNRRSYDVALLNIPEHMHDYSKYQDGLISDDFK